MIDLRKLNGVSREIFGEKVYEYDFLAAFELPDGVGWVNNGSRGFAKYDPAFAYAEQKIPAGSIAVEEGKVSFKLTEKGWVPTGGPQDTRYSYCTGATSPTACYTSSGLDKLN